MATRPQTLAALADSPIGLATFLLDHDVAQPGNDRAFVRRADRRPDAGRCPRQCHAVLADQHRRFVGSALLGEQACLLQSQGRQGPGCRERLPGRALPDAAAAGRSGPIPISSTTTRWKRAATSRPGNSRSSLPKSFARASVRFGNNRSGTVGARSGARRLPLTRGHFQKRMRHEPYRKGPLYSQDRNHGRPRIRRLAQL